MRVAQLGSSTARAWILLVACLLSAATFGALAIALEDAVAGVFGLVALAGAIRIGVVVWRRARWGLRGVEVVAATPRGVVETLAGSGSAVVADQGRLFVSFAQRIEGAWIQRGVVVIGPWRAAFLPTGRRSHFAVEMLIALFAARLRFVDVELHAPAGGDLDAAIDVALLRYGGFALDTTWTYARAQRWLSRPGAPGVVWIEQDPPVQLGARWAATPLGTPSELRARRNRIAKIFAVVIAALVLGGAIAWRAAGEIDYLVAALGWAFVVGIALALGWFGIEKQIRAASQAGAAPASPPPASPFGWPPGPPRV